MKRAFEETVGQGTTISEDNGLTEFEKRRLENIRKKQEILK